MAKLKLQPDPTFKAKVPIPVPGKAEPVEVEFTFKHRSQTAFAELMSKVADLKNVDYVLAVATGWELDDPFTPENIELLTENYHGAVAAIANTYMRELMQLRMGNFEERRARSTPNLPATTS